MKAIRLGVCGRKKHYKLVWNKHQHSWIIMCGDEVRFVYSDAESIKVFNEVYVTMHCNDLLPRKERRNLTQARKLLKSQLSGQVHLDLLSDRLSIIGGRKDKRNEWIAGISGISIILFVIGSIIFFDGKF